MIIVADATPLNYLVLIGQVDVLSQLCSRVLIPMAVCDELQRARTPEPVKSWVTAPPDWLEVRPVSPFLNSRMERLGAGEREAILLAEEVRARWLIMDDYEGRREATRRRLPVIGTLRVLDEAAIRGLIDLPEVLARLESTSFYLSPRLSQWLLERHAKRNDKR